MVKLFRRRVSTDIIFIIILLGFQFLLIRPFFHSGFFPTHDGIQTIRVFEYFQSLKYGVFPPRWASGLLYGYGYPLFVFYNPLVYFFGSIIALCGIGFLTATKLVFILGFFLGVIGVYLLLREITNVFSSLVGSMIYSLAPYRALDVYVRGDLAEFFAFSLFPLIFWINLKFLKASKNTIYLLLLSSALTLLVLTHNISALLYISFLLIFNLFYLIYEIVKKDRQNVIRRYLVVVLLTIFLSAFYVIPLIYEIKFVQIDRITAFSFSDYFLTFKQIWDTPWGYGGFLQSEPMSLVLGKVVILFSFATAILNTIIPTKKRKLIYFFFSALIISTFFETKYSIFVWNNIKILSFLQFPWRLHLVSTFSGVVLVSSFVYLLGYIKIKKFNIKILVVLMGAIIVILAYFETHNYFREKYFIEEKVSAETTTGEEYLPKWVIIKPNNYPPDKVVVLEGKAVIRSI